MLEVVRIQGVRGNLMGKGQERMRSRKDWGHLP